MIKTRKRNKPNFAFLLAKQRFISSILLCAFAVLFAHSIIPHHHHEEATANHQTNHHDDDHYDLNNNFLEQALSHFQHESDSSITFQTGSPTFQGSQFSIDKEAILFAQYFIRQLFKPPIIHSGHSLFAFTPFSYSASTLFRGPPMA